MTLAYLGTASKITGAVLIAATSKSSSSSASTLILLLVVFAAMYFLWLRPQRRKLQQRQMNQIRSFEVGDEVVTQSGIIGTIVALDEDRAEIQVSAGVVLTVVRAAIGRRIEPVVPFTPEVDDGGSDQPSDHFFPHSDDVPQPPARRSFWQRKNRGEDY